MSMGVAPKYIGHTLGIITAYMTRFGPGPFPSEIKDLEIITAIKEAQRSSCLNIVDNMRYGWIDLVWLRESILMNGIDSLVLSKLDELDNVEDIYVCYDYIVDGKPLDYFPSSRAMAKKIKPVFLKLPGWKGECTSTVKKYADLPSNAKNFIAKLESYFGVPISYVSVGPNRSQMIMIKDLLPL